MKIQRLVANGVDFAYLEQGRPDAPLVLCLHGFPDHALTFESLLDGLAAAGFRAVAPWMRGYHPTAIPPDGRYHTSTLALDALALADALAGDGEAMIVGHDWGAGAAYLACAYRPERFTRLVALAVPRALGARFLTNVAQLRRSWYIFFFQMPALPETAVAAGDFAFVDRLWRDWSPGFEPEPAFIRALKQSLSAPGSLDAALGYYRALFRPSSDADLAPVQAAAAAPITVPSLYLHGRDDGCVGAEMVVAEEIEPMFSAGIEIEIIPGCGHFLHLEQPEVVGKRIVEWLGS